jgi:PEP-CTERM motif
MGNLTGSRARRVVVGTLLGLMCSVGKISLAMGQGASGDELLEAARTAIQSGDRTGFATVAEGAGVAALGFVNVRVFVLRREIATAAASGDITPAQAGERLETLADIQSRLAEAKNKNLGGHRDQGKKPFGGTFTSDLALAPTPPPAATLNLDRGAEFILKPNIWGGGTANPAVTSSQVSVRFDPTGGVSLTSLTFATASFDINGMPSGPNTMVLRPNTTGRGELDLVTGEFQARYEGLLTNNLYPASNPIRVFGEAAGFLGRDPRQVFLNTTEPMIIPGVPGAPPLDNAGMAYIATIAAFDQRSGLLAFRDNLNLEQPPDVSIVRTKDGTYISEADPREPLVGARFQLDPLKFLGVNGAGRFLFADSRFSIFNQDGTLATGQLSDIGIDPSSFLFTAEIAFDEAGKLLSPFLQSWELAPEIQLLGPAATLDLVSATEGFTITAASPIDFINGFPRVPEPTTLLLLGSGLAGLGVLRYRRNRAH